MDDASGVEEGWLDGVATVGVTSGASVPDDLVDGVLDRLAASGFDTVDEVEVVRENMRFALPHELRRKPAGEDGQPGR